MAAVTVGDMKKKNDGAEELDTHHVRKSPRPFSAKNMSASKEKHRLDEGAPGTLPLWFRPSQSACSVRYGKIKK